jgi:hypothetical protein
VKKDFTAEGTESTKKRAGEERGEKKQESRNTAERPGLTQCVGHARRKEKAAG